MAKNGFKEKILTAVSAVTADQPAALEEASRKITELFAMGAMPEDVAEATRRAYAELGGDDPPVAVRSSATAEDLAEMSFAGQQENYLNVQGKAMVMDAVKRCRASLWTARAIRYRACHGIGPRDVSLAVVVQKLVDADGTGIFFTKDPLTGAHDLVVINAAWVLGEAIVGGLVTPDMFIIDRVTGRIAEQQINEKAVMTVRTPEGTRKQSVPADQRSRATLSPSQASELARIGVVIEDLYARPMDIEWALHDGHIFVLQACPITSPPPPQLHDVRWEPPTPGSRWIRRHVVENMPEPLSPLLPSCT